MTLDFILDLDHVLVDYVVGLPAGVAPSESLVDVNGAAFRLAKGACEFVDSLLRLPDSRVSFYTRSRREKTAAILHGLRLPSGSRAIDRAHTVFSHLDVVDAATGILLRDEFADKNEVTREDLQPAWSVFAGPRKKDLRRIPGVSLDRAILVDDEARNVAKGQERNFLWLQDTVVPGRTILQRRLEAEVDADKQLHLTARLTQDENRLLFARGFIDEVLEHSRLTGISPSDALWDAQWEENDGKLSVIDGLRFRDDLVQRGGALLFG